MDIVRMEKSDDKTVENVSVEFIDLRMKIEDF